MLAAIDAGSNTLRLLIGDVVAGQVVPHAYRRRICRLAGGMSPTEGLAPAAMERTLAVFRDFAAACEAAGVSAIRAVGTAAFRQAPNGAAFAKQVRDTTGLPLTILSGDDEARYAALGILAALDPLPEQSLLVDIGGGSTEFILCRQQQVLWSTSCPIGVVRLTEGHASGPARRLALEALVEAACAELGAACAAHGIDPASLTLVGTAGTVTTLAALDMGMTDYDGARVNNYVMDRIGLADWYRRLSPLSVAEREALPGMETGRGDLIMAGLEILMTLLKTLHGHRLVVSDFGILEGLLLAEAKAHQS